MKIFHRQSGSTLIMALLLISVMIGGAMVLNTIIVREVQQSRLVNQSIQANYIAESGMERALYQLRKKEAVISCGQSGECLDSGYCSDNAEVPCVSQGEGSLGQLPNEWNININLEDEVVVKLKKGESFQIDLFDASQVSGSSIDEVGVESQPDQLTLYGELTNVTNILGVNVVNCDNQPPVIKGIFQTPALLAGLDGYNILGECSYIFRVSNPLDSFTPEVLVGLKTYKKVFDSQSQLISEQTPLPSRLRIKSQARFGDSLQSNEVSTPIRPPVSGLYDFVLFSEQEVIK
jgi:hypothetical protein